MAQTVLLIEDEPGIVDTIRYALESEGYALVWAGTGAAGLRALKDAAVDLVILDIGLPDGSGFDFCRKIRAAHQVPIIFLTARSAEVDRVAGLEIGADDYVSKPFSPRELAARVRAVLRRTAVRFDARSSEAAPPSGFPFSIDEKRKRISYSGTVLELSRYEYKLLALLIARPGWVFTREQLMDAVWDDPAASMDRTVDAHIKMLRAKLREISPDVEAIITNRGLGYSLKEDW